MSELISKNTNLLKSLVSLIDNARRRVAIAVNSELTILYWEIGNKINRDILQHKRADYGKQVIAEISIELTSRYGGSFAEKNLRRMIQFAEVFHDKKIVVSLIRQLSWTHFIAIIPLKASLQREFYSEMCRVERWSVRTLRNKISGMLYERTAISKKPEKLARMELAKLRDEDRLTPDLVFRDPYFLDFLGLKGAYQEKDMEAAILRELESFIVELGTEFAFLARQKRIIIDNEDFYIDLLFYHRGLKRLIAIDLKLDKFKAAYKGQMELYLRWLERNEMKANENKPIGLILCSEKSPEQINYLSLDNNEEIKVAEYLTKLPEKKILEEKLNKAIALARNMLKE